MRRLKVCAIALCVTVGAVLFPSQAHAQQQSVNVYMGGFIPHGLDGRVDGDVIFNDLSFFFFDPDGFQNFTFGGEWLAALNERVEVGLGIGYYASSTPSVYADYVDLDGTEIRQDLKLRISPITATFRAVPFGRNLPIQPYVGAGVGILPWRYSETGEFVDFDEFIFFDSFSGSGTAVGPVILGGVRIGLGQFDIGFEARHQSGSGELNPAYFAGGRKIDLGGMNYLATFNIRF